MKYKLLFLIVILSILTQTSIGQSFSVEPNEVQAFSENIIYVKIDGYSCDQMQVRTDNGKIKKVANCKYLLIPQRLGSTNITVSKVINNNVIDIGVKKLLSSGKNLAYSNIKNNHYYSNTIPYKATKDEPTFQVIFAGRDGGKIRKNIFSKNNMLTLLSDDPKALKEARISSWRLVVLNNDLKDWDQFMPTEYLDKESQLTLLTTKGEKKIIFSEIRVYYKNEFILLPDIIFELIY
ncbi:MAG TPA: hypothetical protein VLZ83_08585 [Edaphocola sp.]|nr:hypothetical protein [Edaphocola sp.]